MRVGRLTDRDAAVSAARQTLRNAPFFAGWAILLGSVLVPLLGMVGKVIAALSGILFALFAIQNGIASLLGIFRLVAWPFISPLERMETQTQWIAFGTVITVADVFVYLACLYWVGNASNWWGLF